MKTIKIDYWAEVPDNFTGIVERANGTKYWLKDGNLHRLDGPAVEYASGNKVWCKDGNRHRIDGPAVEYANGNGYYFIEDKRYSYKEWLEAIEFYRTLVGELFK